ncbi:tetratricopeptide repeat protein, partial [Salmonella enterica]|uniref:tetratricopeptide repeat protein n=1 Tax=Salmonella enterica TaxID=28901 RepID=UPI003D2664B8
SDYHAGVQAYHAGAFEKAAALFHQALGQNHGSATNAHYYLGLSLERLGEPNRAAAEYAYVIAHGQEAGIVAYAQARFQQLHGTLFPP